VNKAALHIGAVAFIRRFSSSLDGHGHVAPEYPVCQIFAQLPKQLGGDSLVFEAVELGVLVQQGHPLGINFGVGDHAFALVQAPQ